MSRSLIAALAVAAIVALSNVSRAQVPAAGVIVLESNVPTIEAPQVFLGPGPHGKDRLFQIPQGKSIKVMLPSGKILVLAGPRSARVADLIDANDETPQFTQLSEQIMAGNAGKALRAMGIK